MGPDFRWLWAGETVSAAGSAVSIVALPLTAILLLGAGPLEMGVLVALEQVPVPLFGLFAGVWLDRVRRRPVLVATQTGRALLLLSIPVTAWLDVLTLEQLYVVAFATGTLKVGFDLAVTSALPSLLPRSELVPANTRLSFSNHLAGFAGRGAGGALVQVLSAPLAIAIDATSYLASALCMARIGASEAHVTRSAARVDVAGEIAEGFRAVLRQPLIAAMIATSAVGALAGAVLQAVLVLFLTHDLGLSPTWLGAVLAVTPCASFVGAALAPSAARRLGPGPALVAAGATYTIGTALLALADGGVLRVASALAAGQALLGIGLTVFSVNQISLRQALTPDHLLGRVNATRRVLVFGVIPLGALAGGALGESLGLRTTIWIAFAVSALALVVSLLSPLRSARRLPEGATA